MYPVKHSLLSYYFFDHCITSFCFQIDLKILHQVASKLLELYGQLKYLGNPLFFEDTINPLPCSIGRPEAGYRVKETEQTVIAWGHRVDEFRSQYDWLLFFSIPKLLCLYKMLSDKELDSRLQLDKIVHEISFLCKNDVFAREGLLQNVQVIIVYKYITR